MKKITLIAVAAIGMTLFASCKKDYTCTCKVTMGGSTQEVAQTYPKTSKSTAKTACESYETTVQVAGVTAECSLK